MMAISVGKKLFSMKSAYFVTISIYLPLLIDIASYKITNNPVVINVNNNCEGISHISSYAARNIRWQLLANLRKIGYGIFMYRYT